MSRQNCGKAHARAVYKYAAKQPQSRRISPKEAKQKHPCSTRPTCLRWIFGDVAFCMLLAVFSRSHLVSSANTISWYGVMQIRGDKWWSIMIAARSRHTCSQTSPFENSQRLNNEMTCCTWDLYHVRECIHIHNNHYSQIIHLLQFSVVVLISLCTLTFITDNNPSTNRFSCENMGMEWRKASSRLTLSSRSFVFNVLRW